MKRLLSTESLARASARRPWLVVGAWIAATIVAAVLIALFIGDALTTDSELTTNPESKRADRILEQRFRNVSGPRQPNETVVIQSAALTVDNPAFRQYTERFYASLTALGRSVVDGGVNYYQANSASLVSADRHTLLLPLFVRDTDENIERIQRTLNSAEAGSPFKLYLVGNASLDLEWQKATERDLSAEIRIGIPAALVVLVIVFAAIVAALVPLGIALLSIAIALGVMAVIGQAFQFSFFVTNMITMMGLAVGIDYSLFILSRYREERRQGLAKQEAIARAGATASRASLFSGLIVVLSLLGMLLVPSNIFKSLGAGAILVVLIAVLASLTLLPALLSLLGDRVDALRLPGLGRSPAATASGGLWDRTTRLVMRHPVVSLVIAAGLLAALSIPAFDMKKGESGPSTLPGHLEVKQGFDILEREFKVGTIARAAIVVDGDVSSPAVQGAVDKLKAALAADSGFYADQATYRTNAARDLGLLNVPMAGDPNSDQAENAVRRLRSQLIPQAFANVPAQALVTGGTASDIDFFDMTDEYMPIVFIFVLSLSFVLLTIVFRSLVVPAKAILMNMLSVGAAYGLLVVVFQRGVGAGILGFQESDSIEAWIPLFLFSVLFGLSMDYHVFLLSRIRERFGQTRDNDEAVAFGIRTTAGIITGAALIMVAVFAGFASGELVMFQQVGFGLGVAVLLDATIVRSVLVPSAMKLLGTRNWYLPSWLRWLPDLRIEEPAHTPDASASPSLRAP